MAQPNEVISRRVYREAGRALALYILCFNLAKGDGSESPAEDLSTLLRYCKSFAGLSVNGDRTNWRDVAEFWRATHLVFLGGCAAERIKWEITEAPSLSDPEFEKAYYAQQWFWVDLDVNPSEEQVLAETMSGLGEAIEKLESHWKAVEVLVTTLLERSELSAEEAFQTITANIDARKLAIERIERFSRRRASSTSQITIPRQEVEPASEEEVNTEFVQETDLEFSHFKCCGGEDLYPFQCPVCNYIMVFCYECDTLYLDLMNTSISKLHNRPIHCPKCNHKFETNFTTNLMNKVTLTTWINAGYGYLLKESTLLKKGPASYPCPCCGYIVFREPPGSYEICPICYWEDDESQLRFALDLTGANHVSLVEGQRNYLAFGACEEGGKPYVRQPYPSEKRDPEWRMIDSAIDNIEELISGRNYGTTYPREGDALYYWRPNYWRRKR